MWRAYPNGRGAVAGGSTSDVTRAAGAAGSVPAGHSSAGYSSAGPGCRSPALQRCSMRPSFQIATAPPQTITKTATIP